MADLSNLVKKLTQARGLQDVAERIPAVIDALDKLFAEYSLQLSDPKKNEAILSAMPLEVIKIALVKTNQELKKLKGRWGARFRSPTDAEVDQWVTRFHAVRSVEANALGLNEIKNNLSAVETTLIGILDVVPPIQPFASPSYVAAGYSSAQQKLADSDPLLKEFLAINSRLDVLYKDLQYLKLPPLDLAVKASIDLSDEQKAERDKLAAENENKIERVESEIEFWERRAAEIDNQRNAEKPTYATLKLNPPRPVLLRTTHQKTGLVAAGASSSSTAKHRPTNAAVKPGVPTMGRGLKGFDDVATEEEKRTGMPEASSYQRGDAVIRAQMARMELISEDDDDNDDKATDKRAVRKPTSAPASSSSPPTPELIYAAPEFDDAATATQKAEAEAEAVQREIDTLRAKVEVAAVELMARNNDFEKAKKNNDDDDELNPATQALKKSVIALERAVQIDKLKLNTLRMKLAALSSDPVVASRVRPTPGSSTYPSVPHAAPEQSIADLEREIGELQTKVNGDKEELDNLTAILDSQRKALNEMPDDDDEAVWKKSEESLLAKVEAHNITITRLGNLRATLAGLRSAGTPPRSTTPSPDFSDLCMVGDSTSSSSASSSSSSSKATPTSSKATSATSALLVAAEKAAANVKAHKEEVRRLEEQERAIEAEEKRRTELAEKKRAAEAEAKRLADEAEKRQLAEVEAKRLADEAEKKRLAEQEAKRVTDEAEKKRLAEVEAKRLADEAEKKRLAEVDAKRLADEAEKKRLAEVEAQRLADEAEKKQLDAAAAAKVDRDRALAEAKEKLRVEEEAARQKNIALIKPLEDEIAKLKADKAKLIADGVSADPAKDSRIADIDKSIGEKQKHLDDLYASTKTAPASAVAKSASAVAPSSDEYLRKRFETDWENWPKDKGNLSVDGDDECVKTVHLKKEATHFDKLVDRSPEQAHRIQLHIRSIIAIINSRVKAEPENPENWFREFTLNGKSESDVFMLYQVIKHLENKISEIHEVELKIAMSDDTKKLIKDYGNDAKRDAFNKLIGDNGFDDAFKTLLNKELLKAPVAAPRPK